MAYTINTYDNDVLTVVEDGTIDQTTDLKLVGRNYAGYGEIQNENFVFLLENFAGANQPPRKLTGQVWYDAGSGRLKYWNGVRWRNTGGTEVAPEPPVGLLEGDLWWDNDDLQLYAYTGNEFILIGPQDAGEGETLWKSVLIRDTLGINHQAIIAVINDVTVYIVSNDNEYTIDQAVNAYPGFDNVFPGMTQINTTTTDPAGDAYGPGVTSSDHIFWGTVRNAEMLGGVLAQYHIKEIPGITTQLQEAVDVNNDGGIAIGASKDLQIFIENGNEAVIQNQQGLVTKLRVKSGGGADVDVIQAKAGELLPGTGQSVNVGSAASPYIDMYASNFIGTASDALGLRVGGTVYPGSVDTAATGTGNTVAIRDAGGNLNAVLFQGTATKAKYADLAEVYTTDKDYAVGTVMTVSTYEDTETREYTENSFAAIGVISEKPALLMNAEAEGQAIALKGRVPVKVKGPVNKGDRVWACNNGCASVEQKFHLVGIALETNINTDEKLVECFLMV